MTMYNHETKSPATEGYKALYIWYTKKKKQEEGKQPRIALPLQRLATPSRIKRPPSNLANPWYPVSRDEEGRRKMT
jgi:hypothetical protein